MPDDWSWFWASEQGRDRMLRGELEGLQRIASASSAQSARLSSQLRTLQGSMESRLQALSTAFDAYVELGDVREQLAGHPDTSAVRRDVARGLDTLAQGGADEYHRPGSAGSAGPDVAPGTRATLVAWVRPGFEAGVAAVASRVAAEQPAPVVAHTETGDVEVGPDGADPARVAQLDAFAAQRWSTQRSRLLVPGVAAGTTFVVGLVVLGTRVGGLGVLLLVVAAVLAGVTVRELRAARRTRAELTDVRQRSRERVEQARTVAVSVRAASDQTKALVAGLASTITESGALAEPGRR